MCPNGKTIVCAICGNRAATTVDHVPPKGLFPKPRPSDLVTVPACVECNNLASIDDEQFRVFMGMMVGGSHPEGKKLWKEHAMATLRHNNRLYQSILQDMGRVPVQSEGGILLGERPTFLFPVKVYKNVMERTARGLYFHHYGEVLGDRVRCEINFLYSLTPEFVSLSANWPRGQIGEGSVLYRHARASDAPLNSTWVFQFYNAHWALVEFEPAEVQALREGLAESL